MVDTASPPEVVWVDGQAGAVVRPYAMTHGRTPPSRGEFDLITIVVAIQQTATAQPGYGFAPEHGPGPELDFAPEHLTILRRCQRPTSVAELASRLDLPVGIVRVLLGDLLDRRLIRVRSPGPTSELPP